jgi:hypothetical protein
LAVFRDQQIARFDIPMDYVVCMSIVECPGGLSQHIEQKIIVRTIGLGKPGFQVAARNVLHDHIHGTLARENVVNGNNVRVGETANDAGLF